MFPQKYLAATVFIIDKWRTKSHKLLVIQFKYFFRLLFEEKRERWNKIADLLTVPMSQ